MRFKFDQTTSEPGKPMIEKKDLSPASKRLISLEDVNLGVGEKWRIPKTGRVMMEGLTMLLGADRRGQQILKIGAGVYGLINQKTEEIDFTFERPAEELIVERDPSGTKGYVSFSPEEVNFKLLDLTDNSKLEASVRQKAAEYNQSPENFQERLEEAINLKRLIAADLIKVSADGQLQIWSDKFKNRKKLLEFMHANRGARHYLHSFIDFFDFLKDKEAIDLDEKREKGQDLKPRPVFYCPKTLPDAFDLEKIQSADPIIDNYRDFFPMPHWSREIELADGNKVTLGELYLTKRIFGDMQARRNEAGDLLVLDKEDGALKKFTVQLFKKVEGEYKMMASRTKENEIEGGAVGFADNPHRFLERVCPNLLKSGLLTKEDVTYRLTEVNPQSEISRVKRKIGKRGQVFIGGAKLTLGNQLEGAEAVRLAPGLYGVVQTIMGSQEITHVFKPPTPEQIAERRQKVEEQLKSQGRPYKSTDITQRVTFGVNEVEVLPYLATEHNVPFAGETSAAYAERVRLIRSYNVLEKISDRLAKEANVGIHNLSLREQEWLTAGAGVIQKNEKEFIQFAKDFGLPGLKAFLSLEYGTALGETILKISRRMPQDKAKAVFAKYAELTDGAANVEKHLVDNFGQGQEDIGEVTGKIIQQLLQDGQELLKNAADIEEKTLLKTLGDINAENQLFLESFRALKKSGQTLNFAEIKDLSFNIFEANRLDAETVKQMREIYAQNYADQPALCASLLKGFDKAARSDRTKFYLLQYKGKVIAFDRFDDLGDGWKYFGSFNVARDSKNHALGEALMESSLDREMANYNIEAECLPDASISAKYIQKGFRGTQMIDIGGVSVLHIERLRDSAEVESRIFTKQEVKDFAAGVKQPPSGFVARPFQLEELNKGFELINQGFDLVAYYLEEQIAYCLFAPKAVPEEMAKAA